MTDTDNLAALVAAVEAGKYDRPNSAPRYYDFGVDSEGVVPGSRMERMGYLMGGKDACLERLAVLRAKMGDGNG